MIRIWIQTKCINPNKSFMFVTWKTAASTQINHLCLSPGKLLARFTPNFSSIQLNSIRAQYIDQLSAQSLPVVAIHLSDSQSIEWSLKIQPLACVCEDSINPLLMAQTLILALESHVRSLRVRNHLTLSRYSETRYRTLVREML